jgi:hypothetical protein
MLLPQGRSYVYSISCNATLFLPCPFATLQIPKNSTMLASPSFAFCSTVLYLPMLSINACSFAVDDDDLEALSKAFPKLKLLEIITHSSQEPSRITLNGLVPLLKHCPDLETLKISINATHIRDNDLIDPATGCVIPISPSSLCITPLLGMLSVLLCSFRTSYRMSGRLKRPAQVRVGRRWPHSWRFFIWQGSRNGGGVRDEAEALSRLTLHFSIVSCMLMDYGTRRIYHRVLLHHDSCELM